MRSSSAGVRSVPSRPSSRIWPAKRRAALLARQIEPALRLPRRALLRKHRHALHVVGREKRKQHLCGAAAVAALPELDGALLRPRRRVDGRDPQDLMLIPPGIGRRVELAAGVEDGAGVGRRGGARVAGGSPRAALPPRSSPSGPRPPRPPRDRADVASCAHLASLRNALEIRHRGQAPGRRRRRDPVANPAAQRLDQELRVVARCAARYASASR